MKNRLGKRSLPDSSVALSEPLRAVRKICGRGPSKQWGVVVSPCSINKAQPGSSSEAEERARSAETEVQRWSIVVTGEGNENEIQPSRSSRRRADGDRDLLTVNIKLPQRLNDYNMANKNFKQKLKERERFLRAITCSRVHLEKRIAAVKAENKLL